MMNIADMKPKPLYVSRRVVNAGDIVSWAKGQGFTDILDAGDMHVTIAYSRKPVDWFEMGQSWDGELTISEGGPRAVEAFGGGANVLQFVSHELEWRHSSMRENGASWDWDEYRPHITIGYGEMPDDVEPYSGKIVLGPEIFKDLDENWKSKLITDAASGRQMFFDYAPVTKYEETKDGYLLVTADRVARTGIQTYYGWENDAYADIAKKLGKSNNDPIRIYRPSDEVFADAAVNAWAHLPVTVGHPDEFVTPQNYTDLAVGEVSTEAAISSDRKWFGLRFIVKDRAAIDAVHGGKYPETSAGYSSDIELTGGVTPDGLRYDAIQRNIIPNHLALVRNGRAFSDHAACVDKWGAAPLTAKEEPEVDLKTIVVGDKAVQVAASDADIVNKLIADHKAEIDAKDTEIGALKAECADTAKKVLDAAAIDALVQSRVAVIDKARGAVADFDATGKSVEQIRREVVKAIHGDEAAADTVSDAEVKGIFDHATAAKKDDTARIALGDVKAAAADPWAGIIKMKDAK